MFLRRCERRKHGKQPTSGALVESYRTAPGSRQRVVAYLGELKPSEQDEWAKLGSHLAEKDWTDAQEGGEVKLVPAPDGVESFILARSGDRRAKELAMHEQFTARGEAGLKKLQAAA